MKLLQIIWNKKTSLILSIILCLMFIGCDNPNKQNTNIASNDSICNDTIKKEETSAFSPVLLKEIMSFIDKTDDFDMVIPIWAIKKGNVCSLFISNSYFYDTRFLIGYQIIENKMVAFYYKYADEKMNYSDFHKMLDTIDKSELEDESSCLDCLIDRSKLKVDYPTDYLNENSEEVSNWFFDPIGRRYIIHNPDSLELVFEGCY